MILARVLRSLAIVIALAGVIDPAVSSTRTSRPEVAIISGEASGDRALATQLASVLEERFTVIPAAFPAAAATVVVSSRLPEGASELASPVFGVASLRDGASVSIEGVSAPPRVALDARVAIGAAMRTTGATGRTIEATLRMGDVIVDRATDTIAANDERTNVSFVFVPTAIGAVPLRVEARIVDAPATAAADLVLDVHDARWGVLFFDPRPSWLSTFVRRSVERDPRFVVTSRVITSRNLSTDAGRPPSALDDPAALSLFDAVIVGAPEALSARDVAGLESYLRRRGGSVVLLLDERASGPYDRLTGVREWSAASSTAGFTIREVNGDRPELRASSIAWPTSLPAGARAIAIGVAATGTTTGGTAPATATAANPTSATHPVLWRSHVGAGQLIVSGALDAWRYRDPAQSAFDAFWRTTIADAADAARSPLDITLSSSTLAPGQRATVSATVRDAALAELTESRSTRATVSAAIETPSGPVAVRLWPDGTPGRLTGEFRTPAAPGAYRFVATSDGFRVELPFTVSANPATATPEESDLVAAWIASRGGRTISASAQGDLAPALERTLTPIARRETWYPMRSPWWIVPFALLLGAEWLWRRRRGLA